MVLWDEVHDSNLSAFEADPAEASTSAGALAQDLANVQPTIENARYEVPSQRQPAFPTQRNLPNLDIPYFLPDLSNFIGNVFEDPARKRRFLVQMQRHLIMLLHGVDCLLSRTVQAKQGVACKIQDCPKMRRILKHMRRCCIKRGCTFPFCSTSKLFLQHWVSCPKTNCVLCKKFWKATEKMRNSRLNN